MKKIIMTLLLMMLSFTMSAAVFVSDKYNTYVKDSHGRFSFESTVPCDGTVIKMNFNPDAMNIEINGNIAYTDVENGRRWTRTAHGKYCLFYVIDAVTLDKVAVKVIYMDNGDKFILFNGTERSRRYRVKRRSCTR